MVADRSFPLEGAEEHRSHSALVGDVSILADEIQAFGYGGVGLGYGVVHLVNEGRGLQSQLDHARLADLDPLSHRLRLCEEHGILLVLLHLPAVARVDLFDVDRVEVDLLAKLAVDAIEGPSLGPKGRSGIAAEDERDGPVAEMVGECEAGPLAAASRSASR